MSFGPSFGFVPGSYPPRDGNDVRLLIDGGPAFRRVCEAIDSARSSVRATVTFMWAAFEMPDGLGSALDVLERAARRGVDVRVLFWRPDDETASLRENAFWGSPEHFGRLRARAPSLRVRWDRAQPGFCQHQKTWLVDADGPDPVAFVGGINLNPHSVVAPGHDGEGQNHDLYVEMRGPSVADVAHNFAQRWNGASERDAADGHRNAPPGADLAFPSRLPGRRGDAAVQIQRTVHAGRLRDGRAPPGGAPHDIARGERSVLAGYLDALRGARRSVYVEQQYVEVPEIVAALRGALERGVEVVLVMPPAAPGAAGSPSPERASFLAARAALGAFPNFALCGLLGRAADGRRVPVHVHAKAMLVDDAWATVGSANLHRFSLLGNAELNAAIASPGAVRAFRAALFAEHLARDTSGLDDREALRLFARVARENRARLDRGDAHGPGLAVALDVASYGRQGG